MTKASANPRRYSRGPEGLDPNLPLNVYISVRTDSNNLDGTIARLEYLAEKHPDAVFDLVAYQRIQGDIRLTLEVLMGPARQALRGTTPLLQAGYAFLWDLVLTLFNNQPILCGPPSAEERQTISVLGRKPKLNAHATAAVNTEIAS